MTTKFTLDCMNGTNEATIVINSPFIGLPTWNCVEGEEVWGNPSNGTAIKDMAGTFFLGAGAGTLGIATLHSFDPAKINKKGLGTKTLLPGFDQGTFPDGDFTWEISKIS